MDADENRAAGLQSGRDGVRGGAVLGGWRCAEARGMFRRRLGILAGMVCLNHEWEDGAAAMESWACRGG